MHGQEAGYNLSKPVTEILKSVFASKLDLLDDVCLRQQRAYFDLGPDVGWVSKNSDKVGIYQAKPCPVGTK
jgi:hypothetical protein